MTLSGANFKSGETVKVYWDSTSGTLLNTLTANGSCAISGGMHVPAAVNGAHTLIAVGQTSGEPATHSFSVVARETLNPTSTADGAKVNVAVSGFKANQVVTVRWNTRDRPVLATVTTNGTGGATTSFNVPPSAASGHHSVFAVGTGGNPSANATLTIP